MSEPSFYLTRTLLGFGYGEQDLNRIILQMPGHRRFVLCEIGEPRTEEAEERWRKLAAALRDVWQLAEREDVDKKRL